MKRNLSQRVHSISTFIFRSVIVFLLLFLQAFIQPVSGATAAPVKNQPLTNNVPGIAETISNSAPTAATVLNLPTNVFLKQDVSFLVTFQNTGTSTGYGPVIFLIIPTSAGLGKPGTSANIKASYAGTSLVSGTDLFFATFNASNNVTQPLIRDSVGNLVVVNGNDTTAFPGSIKPAPGDTLLAIKLPFGSYSSGQPKISVDITVNMTAPADVALPMKIWARGGYQFGMNPLDDWCCGDVPADTLSAWSGDTVTPILWTLSKSYNGPENETATGPNFIRQYTLGVDIASGETISNLDISDLLPANMQFVSVASVTPAGSVSTTPSVSAPGGTLNVHFNSVVGTASTTDITIIFNYYIPLTLADGTTRILDAVSGASVVSCNNATATGTWRTLAKSLSTGTAPATCGHTLNDRSIAIQKGSAVNGAGILKPGALVKNTLDFQVSDFFAFDNVKILDIISDGQHFYAQTGFEPTLLINGNTYNLAAQAFDPANFDVACFYTSPLAECETSFPSDSANPDQFGTTQLTFRVSSQIKTITSNVQNGNLIGGCVDPAGGSVTPLCAGAGSYNNGPTTGQIIFYTKVLDNFVNNAPSGDKSVDQGDVLTNSVKYILGDVLDTNTFVPTGSTPQDNSGASLSVPLGKLDKTIYAVNGNTSFTKPVKISAGDKLTYLLSYDLPVGNEENMRFTDYLPLPIFKVTDPAADGSSSFAWTFSTATDMTPGVVSLSPTDTFYNYMVSGSGTTGAASVTTKPSDPADPLYHDSSLMPKLVVDSTNNSVTITYPNYNDTRLAATKVALLITVTATNEPFADQLYLTNEAYSYEGSTNGGITEATKINQIQIGEPVLVTKKSAIWAGRYDTVLGWQPQTTAAYSPALPAALSINAPSAQPRWNGTIFYNPVTSTGNAPVSNVTHVDANDVVTFMIVIQDQGHTAKGAFDLAIKDTLQSIFQIPTSPTGLNLHVYRGDGSGVDYGVGHANEEIQYTKYDPADPATYPLFGKGIKLIDPADNPHLLAAGSAPGDYPVCQAHTLGAGKNVVVITYDLQIKPDVIPGTATNTAQVVNYASRNNGPNFIPSGGSTDSADTTIDSIPTKYLISTSEKHTAGTKVAVGEIVRYRITATIPENPDGVLTNFQVRDILPTGLRFLNDGTATAGFVANNAIAANVTGLSAGAIAPATVTGTLADAATPVSTGLAPLGNGNVGSSNSISADPDVYNTDTSVYFKFGDITNSDDDLDYEYVVIEFNALVDNTSAGSNDNGDIRTNTARVTINAITAGSDSSALNVTVVEPVLTITKTNSAILTTVDSGDLVNYTVTLKHSAVSSADALDVHFFDTLPSPYLVLDLASIKVNGVAPVVGDNHSTGNTVDLTMASLPLAGGNVVITYSATASISVSPQQAIDNKANATWTSLPGDGTPKTDTVNNPTGSENLAGSSGGNYGERNGISTPLNINDYAINATSQIKISPVAPVKSIISTSEAGTLDDAVLNSGIDNAHARPLAIGEIMRYRLAVELPEGTSPNFIVTDVLPSGFTFMPGTIKLGYRANNAITNADAVASAALLANNDGLPADAAPTMALPAGFVSYTALTHTLVVDLKTPINNDLNDGNLEYVVLEFNVLVNNDANNNNTNIKNNNFTVSVTGPAGVATSTSNTVVAEIVEPVIPFDVATNNKTLVSPVAPAASPDAGDTITYRVTYTNTGLANAYEVDVADTLNSTYFTAPVIPVSGIDLTDPDCAGAFSTDKSAGNKLDVLVGVIAPQCTVVVTYTTTLKTAVMPAQVIQNTASITYSSLPGVGTSPNATGSITPGVSGASDGERNNDNTQTGGNSNDYNGSDSAQITTADVSLTKAIFATSALHTAGSDVAIGEEITYDILLTFPEGTTPADVVVDALPAGLAVVDTTPEVITTVLGSGGSLTANFNGTIGTQNIAVVAGDAGSVTYNFTNVVVTADDNTSNNTILLRFRAQVTDIAGNKAGGVISNKATNQVGTAPVLTSNVVTATVVEPSVTFSKTIVSLPSPLDAGGVVQYQIKYINGSGVTVSTAMDVHITDLLPTQLGLNMPVTVTLAGGAAGASDLSLGNKLDVTIASVPAGGSVTIDFTATIQNAITAGEIVENISDATWTSLSGIVTGERTGADGPKGSPDNYAATDKKSFTTLAAVTISKQLFGTSAVHTSGSDLAIGEEITYDILLTFPEGVTPADTVVDTLPAGLEVVSGTPEVITTAAGSGGSLAENFNGAIGTTDITVVSGDGGSVTYAFTNVSPAGDNNALNNTFLLRFTALVLNVNGNQNNNTLDNVAKNQVGSGTLVDSNTVSAKIVEPELQISKSADNNNKANYTKPITFTLTISNLDVSLGGTSTANAYNVVVTDLVPANFTYLPGTITAPAGWTKDELSSPTLTWKGDLPLGSTATFTFQAKIDDPALAIGTTITNTADAKWSSLPDVTNTGTPTGPRDGSGSVNDYSTSASRDVVYENIDLSIVKTASPSPFALPQDPSKPAAKLTYTLDYENSGNLDAGNATTSKVVVTEKVPVHTTFDGADNPGWDCAGLTNAPAGTVCTYLIDTIPAKSKGSLKFIVTVDMPFPANTDTISNTVSIDDNDVNTIEPTPSNNTSSIDTKVNAGPSLLVTKTDAFDIVSAGTKFDYTIVVTNNGNQDLTGIDVVDTLPAQVTFNSASASGSASTMAGVTVITWPKFDLPASGLNSRTFTVTVTVNDVVPTHTGTPLSNTVDVSDDGKNSTGQKVAVATTHVDTLADSNLKTLAGTGEIGSATPNVFIGEFLTYQINIDVPQGTMVNLHGEDVLARGLAFVDCQSITAGTLTTTLNNPASTDFSTACNPPTNPLVTAEPAGSADPINAGRRITFDLGNVTNNSTTIQTITINYRVVVLDIPENNIKRVDDLNNAVTWNWDGITKPLTGSTESVKITEPSLSIIKQAAPTTAPYGSPITFTLDIAHTAESSAHAYDVTIIDVLPPGLAYIPGSVVLSGLAPTSIEYLLSTTTLRFFWDEFPLGQIATIQFQANFVGPSPVQNEARVEWTSLPIDPGLDGKPVKLSTFNDFAIERWYDPNSLTLNNYSNTSSVSIKIPKRLPTTGFAPDEITEIALQPASLAYVSMPDMWLEIPDLGVNLPVTGVPMVNGEWDLTWLSNQAGYLAGTTYPGQLGTTGITAHVTLADGTPGPFRKLGTLMWGNKIILHANGQRYVYEVRELRTVIPTDLSVFKKDAYTWLTLLTCKDYAPSVGTYSYRTAVRAVLMSVEPDQSTSPQPAQSGGH